MSPLLCIVLLSNVCSIHNLCIALNVPNKTDRLKIARPPCHK
nr:MAG TPA: hypothetical protein [Bacteriophage sp.]DAQ38702.1 MAG TPA: hypothetical protein [Caudoviricetes sp.]